MPDNFQIGVTGESEPEFCGCGCGETVKGRHSVSHSLGNGRYTLYLAKHDHMWNEAHPAAPDAAPVFRKIVMPSPVTPSVVQTDTKKGKDQS